MTNPLIGKIFTRDNGEEFTTGVVIDQIGEDQFLIQSDAKNDVPIWPLEVIDKSELSLYVDDEYPRPRWLFFEDREQLQKWTDWIDKEDPKTPKIVKMGK